MDQPPSHLAAYAVRMTQPMAKAKRRKGRKAKKPVAGRTPGPELNAASRAQLDTRRAPAKRESVEDPLRDWPQDD